MAGQWGQEEVAIGEEYAGLLRKWELVELQSYLNKYPGNVL